MIMVFPDEDGPNSFVRSTLMIRVLPSTVISMFFMLVLHAASFIRTFWALNCLASRFPEDGQKPSRAILRLGASQSPMPLGNAGDELSSPRGRKSSIEIPLPKIGVLPGITLTEKGKNGAMLIHVEPASLVPFDEASRTVRPQWW